MRIILCVLLAASVASAQLVRGNTVVSSRPSVGSPAPVPDATLAADPLGSAGATASAGASAGAGASASAAGASAAAGAGAAGAAAAPGGGFGPAFFGPGLNNPLALPPNGLLIQRAQEVAAGNPNVRVFVDVDGTVEFTDQFGREIEVVDQFGFDALEPIDPKEQQKLLLKSRQQEFNLRRQLLEQQLLQEFGLAPGGQGFATGAQAGAAQVGAAQVGAPQVGAAPGGAVPGLQRQFRIVV
ncbi:glycine-rich protein 1-like [Macrobrachium nipponense]|uniref:glycine-rich protein 1-like n=1 Tax=Macrobrachium nipponense TaxID=159736 RepID=UPI0030C83FE2